MSRKLLHLTLVGVLLGCPYLCFTGCPAAERAATCERPVAGCRCCGDGKSRPTRQPIDAPTDRDHKCDCLCKGAVYDSKAVDAVDLLATGCWCAIAPPSACVVSGVQTGREAVAVPDELRFAGHALRALYSSWLC